MFGGDPRVNRYVERFVVPAAARLGVKVDRVPVDDTAAAVQRVLAERRAGKESGGAVDLIWLNGENFAQGKRGGLWLRDWAPRLPNARFLDPKDPLVRFDFGVAVDGQESPWSRAAFVFAHDRRRTPTPPRSFDELLKYARENPGRVTYPAPPDFTGSAFVRQAVQALGEKRALELLAELKPLQHRRGKSFPRSEADLNRLFGDGQVDIAMSYDPSFVANAVGRGEFPRSTRPYVFDGGTLQNMSFVTIPRNAAHVAGAKVVANLLLDPRLQAKKADPSVAGIPTALSLARLDARDRRRFDAADANSYALERFGKLLEELPADRVPALEQRWKREVLR
jgi:putative spermidine/putrescine transport system substrate-binding protein